MEMPVDVLNKRLGAIRDNGDIDFDNTMAAVDIDTELQDKFIFIPLEEIEAIKPQLAGDRWQAGSGPEMCDAMEHENPNWLYNHAVNALALWQHLKLEQDRLAKRPEPGVYQAYNGFSYFTAIVTEDRRVLVQATAGGGLADRSDQWDASANGPWHLQRIDTVTGAISA